jgi:RNA polymerase sigma-70 factor, ECF subfamily
VSVQGRPFAATRRRTNAGDDAALTVFRRRSVLNDDHDDPRLHRAITAAQRGEREAIRELYARYADNVYGYVRSIVADPYEAEDVTQHVFLKLMTVISKYERGTGPFAAWMLRVARNVAIDHLRKRQSVPVEEVFGPDVAARQTASRQQEPLWQALAGLPMEQREVVVLRHIGGLSPVEIAEHLGKTTGSIHGLHHRGRAALKRELTVLGSRPAVRGGRPQRLAGAAAA